ncbi:MAG: hypothetical protein O2819_04730 [Planctomycetota bacterium]|nr:hypothetical protein [Planctomycetota bacterium]MDA1105141.1 hypothetical protein [Planctomycetota bacterium]
MRRLHWLTAAALACSVAAVQASADGGRLVARGTLHGAPVAVYVSPATPRAGEPFVVAVAGESLRSEPPRGAIIGPGGAVVLAFAAEPGEPLAVESAAQVAELGIYELRVEGMEPASVAIAVADSLPEWFTWLPWLAPAAVVGLLAVLRRRSRTHTKECR